MVAGAVVAVACSIQTIFPYGTAPQPGTASQTVGAGGGIVTADDGTSLFIPPNALSTATTITIALAPQPDNLPQATALGAAHVFGPPGQIFAKPVCITASFEPERLPAGVSENSVVLYVSGGDAAPFVPLPTMAASPTQVTGTTDLFEGPVVVGYGAALETDAGMGNCDANQLDAEEAAAE